MGCIWRLRNASKSGDFGALSLGVPGCVAYCPYVGFARVASRDFPCADKGDLMARAPAFPEMTIPQSNSRLTA